MLGALATIARPATSRGIGWVSRPLSACRDGIFRHFIRRAAIKTLRALDDRALRDIGLERSQIEKAVCGFTTPSGRARR